MKPNLKENFYINTLSRFVGDKPAKTDVKSRLIDAAKYTVPLVGGELLLRALIRKKLPLKKQLKLKWRMSGSPRTKVTTKGFSVDPNEAGKYVFGKGFPKVTRRPVRAYAPIGTTFGAASTALSGYFNADLKNALIKLKKDPSEMDNVLEKIRSISKINQSAVNFSKTAFFRRAIGGTARAIGSGLTMGLGKGGTNIAHRIAKSPIIATGSGHAYKPFTIPERVFGAATKVGVGGAGIYGLSRGAKAIRGIKKRHEYPYEANYTTMLRNNMLAGNIHPGELRQEDINSVRKLGMK